MIFIYPLQLLKKHHIIVLKTGAGIFLQPENIFKKCYFCLKASAFGLRFFQKILSLGTDLRVNESADHILFKLFAVFKSNLCPAIEIDSRYSHFYPKDYVEQNNFPHQHKLYLERPIGLVERTIIL